MIWIIGLILAVLALVATVWLAIWYKGKPHTRFPGYITPFRIVFVGVGVITLFLLLPVYAAACDYACSAWFKIFLFSLQGTFQVFTIDADTDLIRQYVNCQNTVLAPLYSNVLSVLYVVAPILTFTFVASFFKNLKAYYQLFLRRNRKTYVFTEINARSMALAADIRKEEPKAVIVFTDVFENTDEASYERVSKAREAGYICFKKDVLELNLQRMHNSAAELFLFVIGSNESENIGQALKIIQMYREEENYRLYIFTNRAESSLLFAGQQGLKMRVHRIDEAQSLAYRILYERGTELFDKAIDPHKKGRDKTIHAVIVGLGDYGMEMLKALTWYCQMDGYRIEIDAYDKNENAKARLWAQCPELMSETSKGKTVPKKAEYKICIHSKIDVTTSMFADYIAHLTGVTYVFVALGSDSDNAQTAVNLRTLFLRQGSKPVIQALIRDSEESSALRGICDHKGQSYSIGCVGDISATYTKKTIIHPDMEDDGLLVHLNYALGPDVTLSKDQLPEYCRNNPDKVKEFWAYDYNYWSSICAAIHNIAKIHCKIPGADKLKADRTAEEEDAIGNLEHRRWEAYMRGEGYIKGDKTDHIAKTHVDLIRYEDLDSKEKQKAKDVTKI